MSGHRDRCPGEDPGAALPFGQSAAAPQWVLGGRSAACAPGVRPVTVRWWPAAVVLAAAAGALAALVAVALLLAVAGLRGLFGGAPVLVMLAGLVYGP